MQVWERRASLPLLTRRLTIEALDQTLEQYGRRACTISELMYAAAGPDNNRYPYGNEWIDRVCDPDDANPEPNLDQLNVIFSVLGTPQGPLGWIELPEMRDYLHSLSPLPPTPLAELYPAAPAAALELLEATLRPESLSVVEYSLLIVDG